MNTQQNNLFYNLLQFYVKQLMSNTTSGSIPKATSTTSTQQANGFRCATIAGYHRDGIYYCTPSAQQLQQYQQPPPQSGLEHVAAFSKSVTLNAYIPNPVLPNLLLSCNPDKLVKSTSSSSIKLVDTANNKTRSDSVEISADKSTSSFPLLCNCLSVHPFRSNNNNTAAPAAAPVAITSSLSNLALSLSTTTNMVGSVHQLPQQQPPVINTTTLPASTHPQQQQSTALTTTSAAASSSASSTSSLHRPSSTTTPDGQIVQQQKYRSIAMSSQMKCTMDEKPKPLVASPKQVMHLYMCKLTPYEHHEIFNYPQIYFIGANAKKRPGLVGPNNSDYDNEHGSYIHIPHDHVAYRYEVLKIIGKGSFGQVVKAYDHKTHEHVALKMVRNEKRFHRQAQEEIRILQHLRKQDKDNTMNIIHMFDFFTFRNHMCITFEILYINLYELIKRNKFQGFSLQLVRKFAHSLLQCLDALSKNKIIHCDMKPENVLLKQQGRSGIKVSTHFY